MHDFYGRQSRRRGWGGFAKFEDFPGPAGQPGPWTGPGGGPWTGPGGGPGGRGGQPDPWTGPGGGPGGPGPGPDPEFGFGPGHGPGHWHGGPPPWRGGRRARRGDIRWALLIALLDGPSHGYELITRLESRTGGMWRPSAGSVYPTLQLLEDEGLIRGRDDEGKRVFELTDEGRAAATQASERIGRGPWGGGGTAGARAELPKAMKTLALALRQVVAAGDEEQITAAVGVITDARQRLYRILAGEDTASPGGSPQPPRQD